MPYDPDISEEELKNRVARDAVGAFDCARICGERDCMKSHFADRRGTGKIHKRQVRKVRKVHHPKLRGLRGLRARHCPPPHGASRHPGAFPGLQA